MAMEFTNVTATAVANIYFDGKVVSHKITFEDGSSKTLGLMYPGDYHFGTEAAERMEITDGSMTISLDGSEESKTYAAGTHFDVPANSGFSIIVKDAIVQYVCSYIEA